MLSWRFVTDAQLAAVQLEGDPFHCKWNDTITRPVR